MERRTMLVPLMFAFACSAELEAPDGFRDAEFSAVPEVSAIDAPLDTLHCSIDVDGRGRVGLERDYLPHVVACEAAGDASMEALRAQAVAARSVAYYELENDGSICDSQGCQVYSCGKAPKQRHYQAVAETEGLYLMHGGTLTYAFFVAGDATPNSSCVGSSGETEKWVTYNEGRRGHDVEQTELGFRHKTTDRDYGQNRGCMAQNGAVCLEQAGYDWLQILEFYYGQDIGIDQIDTTACNDWAGIDDGGRNAYPNGDVPADQVDADAEQDEIEDDDSVSGCSVGGRSTAPVSLVLLGLLGRVRRRRTIHART